MIAVAPRRCDDVAGAHRVLDPGEGGERDLLHVAVVLQRLRDRPARYRLPLRGVRLEETWAGPSVEEQRQLPHRVVHALDAGVDAESAGRRKLARRVAYEDD